MARQAPLCMEFSRQEYWSGLPFPSPGDLPYPGIKPRSPALQWTLYRLSHQGSPNCSLVLFLCHLCRYKLGYNLSSFQRICWTSQRIAESPRQVSTLVVSVQHVSHLTKSPLLDGYSLMHPLSWTISSRQKPPSKFSGLFFSLDHSLNRKILFCGPAQQDATLRDFR